MPFNCEKEKYFICAVYQGKTCSAWWISRYISYSRIWELLEWISENIHNNYNYKYKECLESLKDYDKLLGFKTNEYDIIIQCQAIVMMCITYENQEKSFKLLPETIDNTNIEILNTTSKLIGYRDRRLYSIPKMCLYGITLRGRIRWSQNNLSQLNNIEKYIIGCPFWDETLKKYATIDENGQITWNSDDTMEQFYDTYFPDDIPDEWNKNDKLKSHGDGILGPNEKISILKYSRNMLHKLSRFSWNTSRELNSYLETIEETDCSLENIIKYYKMSDSLSNEQLKELRPVHKIKIYN